MEKIFILSGARDEGGGQFGKGGGCTWKGAAGRFLRDRAVVYLDYQYPDSDTVL